MEYTHHINVIEQSAEFKRWLSSLKDLQGKTRILARIRNAEQGHLGDFKPVGGGLSEMRIHTGPGYRLYFTRRGEITCLLLLGGDKVNQKRDIKRAREMARNL